MARDAIAVIDLASIKHNFSIIRSLLKNQQIYPMIKANAYGHGAVEVAKALTQVDALADGFGVACVAEALRLREAGITQEIMLASGFHDRDELKAIEDYDLSPVIMNDWQISALESYCFTKNISVWFKLDTGMHRLGFNLDEALNEYQRLVKIKNIHQPINLMTHFSKSDSDSEFTGRQIKDFNLFSEKLTGKKSLANSAGILNFVESHADVVRPGIMLYGASPFDRPLNEELTENLNFKSAMTFKAKLIAINYLKKGDAVGYGGEFICSKDMAVGVVAVGYGDGYPRHAKTGTPVLINDSKATLVGRVSMDLISIDLNNCHDAKIGDEVILWGADLPVDVVAKCASTVGHELLTGLTGRVEFQYKCP